MELRNLSKISRSEMVSIEILGEALIIFDTIHRFYHENMKCS